MVSAECGPAETTKASGIPCSGSEEITREFYVFMDRLVVILVERMLHEDLRVKQGTNRIFMTRVSRWLGRP